MEHNITGNVLLGTPFNFELNLEGDRFLTFITPIMVGNSTTHWAIGVAIPIREITMEARNAMLSGILVAFMGIIVLAFVLF